MKNTESPNSIQNGSRIFCKINVEKYNKKDNIDMSNLKTLFNKCN